MGGGRRARGARADRRPGSAQRGRRALTAASAAPATAAAAANANAAVAPPATTQELARRLGASPAGVSEHLGILRRAGLIEGRREGRAVRYGRARMGDELAAPGV
jgi:DNA-binding transcriptional ArsR family regulator